MKKEDIERLPPELRPAAEFVEIRRRRFGLSPVHEMIDAALTWGLRVVEEKVKLREELARVYKLVNHWSGAAQTAEATIATLTRERDEARREATILRQAYEGE